MPLTNVAPVAKGASVSTGVWGSIIAFASSGPAIAISFLALGTYIGHHYWKKHQAEKITDDIVAAPTPAFSGIGGFIDSSTDQKIDSALHSSASQKFNLGIDEKRVWQQRRKKDN
jgi:hypothetical protein